MMVLDVPGIGQVEIMNEDDFKQELLFLIKESLVNEIQREAMKLGLFDGGNYVRGIRGEIEGDTITFTNDTPYAVYLEYGTYEFGEQYSEETWPASPFPKKKDLSPQERGGFPRGMQPFAAYRKILYLQERFDEAMARGLVGGAQ